ncbi:hypothetical protein V2J09_011898 [Rumex salicifolius]
MGQLWTFITQLHYIAGPIISLLYPLYASVVAMESTSKADDKQWLAYWIIYSLLTLTEMIFQPILQVPIWYTAKLVVVTWMVLPQFKGAAFIYERYVRHNMKIYMPSAFNKFHSSSYY